MATGTTHLAGLVVLALILAASTALGAERQPEDWESSMRRAEEAQRAGQYGVAAEILERLAGHVEEPGDRNRLAINLHNLGVAYFNLGRYSDARGTLERSLLLLPSGEPRNAVRRILVLNCLATVCLALGQHSRVEQLIRDVTAAINATPAVPLSAVAERDLNLAKLHLDRGRDREAQEVILSAQARARGGPAAGSALAIPLLNLYGSLLTRNKRWEQAVAVYEEVVRDCIRTFGGGHPTTAKSMINLAFACRQAGRLTDAERLAREAVALLESGLGPRHLATGAALSEYAAALKALKRTREAKSASRRSRDILDQVARENQMGEVLDVSVLAFQERR